MPKVKVDADREIAVAVAVVTEHVKDHDCLPFPAGPIVPRARSKEQPLLDMGLSEIKRARVGLALLKADYIATAERADTSTRARPNPKSRLNALIGYAAAEWASRHPDINAAAAVQGTARPDQLMLRTLLRVGQATHESLAKEAVAAFTKRGKLRHSRGNATPLLALPYAAPTYRCQCQECADVGPVEQLAEAAVAKALAQPGDEWILLSQFFLKQLHSHLGWMPNRQAHEVSRNDYYGHVLEMLNAFARRREAGSAAAAGLVIALPKLAPYWQPAGKGVVVSHELPQCFWPEAIGDCDAACTRARRYLTGHGDLDTLVLHVDDLARETAAMLTDPVVAPHIGLCSNHLTYSYMAERYRQSRIKIRAAAKAAGNGVVPAWPVDPQFMVRHLDPRMSRMVTYTRWMKHLGHTIASAAVKESHPGVEPQLRPTAFEISAASEGSQ